MNTDIPEEENDLKNKSKEELEKIRENLQSGLIKGLTGPKLESFRARFERVNTEINTRAPQASNTKTKKWPIFVLGSISIIGFAIFEFSFSSDTILDFSKTENTYNIQNVDSPSEHTSGEQEEIAWQSAQETLTNFHRKWNLHQFEATRMLLTEGAKEKSPYSIVELSRWQSDLVGTIGVGNIQREHGESSETVKVFSFERSYKLKATNLRKNLPLKAYIVLVEDKWLIDSIQNEAL